MTQEALGSSVLNMHLCLRTAQAVSQSCLGSYVQPHISFANQTVCTSELERIRGLGCVPNFNP